MRGGIAGLVGVVLGGVLTAELSWRWVLFVNIPPGAVLLAAGMLFLFPTGSAERIRLDLPGALTVTVGVGLLTYGLSEASDNGWGASNVVIPLLVAVVPIATFFWGEVKSAHAVGLAVLVNVASSATSRASPDSGPPEALVHGYRVAFLVNAGIMVIAAPAALTLPAMKKAKAETPAPADGPAVTEP
ncbi:hypothetical protein MMF93_23705 [Streptomyces tubbatahanensis]|uniref:Uncharacterized protein n=1 Tax=Streptomyces tubbatahanensis TaxID=2923272 RepID=A0ABY3XX81_9ACTN|nr:hypothetical protein [Streptomyces tubbatahanensis]UNS99132.1 hypothetical protein MMF93_23705 [Streptomyces tubbatahanensis]